MTTVQANSNVRNRLRDYPPTNVHTNGEINEWIRQGCVFLMREAPIQALEEVYVHTDAALVGDSEFVGEFTLPAAYLRYVLWISGLTAKPAKLVSPAYGYLTSNGSSDGIDVQRICVWIEEGKLKGNTHDSQSEDGDLIYVPIPADITEIPSKLDDIVIDYAIAQAKHKEGKMEEYGSLMGLVANKLQALGNG